MDSSARALVLDDNQHMRFMLAEMLRAIGFGGVAEAATCEQARDQLAVRSYAVMFADIGLVHETSLGLIREIRAHHRPAIRNLPIIVISGQNLAATVADAREAGATAFLAKPLSVAALTGQIALALKRSPPDDATTEAGTTGTTTGANVHH